MTPAPAGLDPLRIALLAGLIAIVLLASLALAIRENRRQGRLRNRIAALSAEFRPAAVKAPPAEGSRRRSIRDRLNALEERTRGSHLGQIQSALHQAGLALTMRDYWLICAATAIAAVLPYLLLGFPPLGAPPVAFAAGVGLPRMAVRLLAERRKSAFTRYFADALDVIVRGVRSGLPVGECLNIIARESPDPVGPEFRAIIEETRLGLRLEEALQRAVERMPTDELKFFSIVLSIQQQTGGNLAEVLGNLSHVLRGRSQLREKIKALSSEARASAMIIGALPFCVGGALAVLNPDYVSLLVTDSLGHVMLAGSAVWMAMGIVIMRKMINFDA